MNYKSGDLVKITGNSNRHDFVIGETVRLQYKGRSNGWRAESLNGISSWYVMESDMAPVKPATMPQKIIITTDGKTTLARLFDGKKMVKRAEAKCASSDTFNFNTGANLAFNRLVCGTDYNPQDVAVKAKPAASDKLEPVKLYCVKKVASLYKCGSVYETDAQGYMHMEGRVSSRTYSSADDFFCAHPQLKGSLVPLVRRPAKVGEWVLVTDSAADRFIGTVGKVERINSDGNPSVRHKKVLVDTHGDGTENTSMNGCKYLVLDGYTGDPV